MPVITNIFLTFHHIKGFCLVKIQLCKMHNIICGNGTMAEHSPLHLKVQGLSPASTVSIGSEKKEKCWQQREKERKREREKERKREREKERKREREKERKRETEGGKQL